MILIPAIDIKNGQVVRLFQGDFGKETRYDWSPVAAAEHWEGLGAQYLHLVDLDGAKDGVMANQGLIVDIVRHLRIPVEVGGGIRSLKTVADLIEAGVARVILGTKVLEDRSFLQELLAVYGQKICVSLDCSNGFVAQRGWVSTTGIKAVDLALELEAMGLSWMVYTDIARDGTLQGPNLEQLQTMLDAVSTVNIIASGGIASLGDVEQLARMKGIAAAITGKAIYEGKLDFKAALEKAARC